MSEKGSRLMALNGNHYSEFCVSGHSFESHLPGRVMHPYVDYRCTEVSGHSI